MGKLSESDLIDSTELGLMVTFKLIEAKIQQTALCYFGKPLDDKTLS